MQNVLQIRNRPFGLFHSSLGICGQEDGNIGLAEVDDLNERPVIELGIADWARLASNDWTPESGMIGESDDGTVYGYNGQGGFWGKLWKKVKKGVKSVAKGAIKLAKVAAKGLKTVVKAGMKLAPVAALIPGIGPMVTGAISALKLAGKLGKMVTSHGGNIVGNKIRFVDPAKKALFVRSLIAEKRAALARG